MRIIIAFLVLFTAVNVQAHRENTYYLKGTIGDQEVGLRLDEFGETCFVRYFDIKDKQDKLLEGEILENNQYKLHSYQWDSVSLKKIPRETLLFHEIQDHQWQGTWLTTDGIETMVHLRPIIIDSMNHPHLEGVQYFPEIRMDAYAAYRCQNLLFVNVKKEKIGKGQMIQWVIEPVSGIKHFRILASKKGAVNVDRMNQFLTLEHIKLVDSKMACVNSAGQSIYRTNTKVHYLSQRFLSYELAISSACLGVVTEQLLNQSTRYIETGAKAMLEDIVWFGKKPQPVMREGGQAWHQYRYKVFGEKVMALLQERYPSKFKSESGACNYLDERKWQFPNWHLSKKGLYLGSTSISGNIKCDNAPWSVLPWKKIKPYINGI